MISGKPAGHQGISETEGAAELFEVPFVCALLRTAIVAVEVLQQHVGKIPSHHIGSIQDAHHAGRPQQSTPVHGKVELPVWDSLGRSSAYKAFAEGAGIEAVVSAVARFEAGAVLGVDWTSFQAYRALSAGLQQLAASVPPYVFMNYRSILTFPFCKLCLSEQIR